jgi:thiosulfate/3-mercaptopyruvate sulfurtransferase
MDPEAKLAADAANGISSRHLLYNLVTTRAKAGECRDVPRQVVKNMRSILLVFLLPCAIYAAPACGGHGDRSSMLVSTGWLAEHLRDPNLAILAIGTEADFAAGHIPGAVALEYRAIQLPISAEQPLNLQLPPAADLEKVFAALGVSNDSRIILYMSKDWIAQTARVWLTLDAMGLGAQTSVLDGGLPAWQREGRAVSAETRHPAPGKLKACTADDVVVDVESVRSNMGRAGVRVVDARLPQYYSGETPGRNQRPGHIPGATSIPFSSLVDEQGKLKPAAELERQFREAGVKTGERVVSYCHIGQQASLVYFVARYLGFDARLYDGSFEDWSRHAELPVEKAATAGR